MVMDHLPADSMPELEDEAAEGYALSPSAPPRLPNFKRGGCRGLRYKTVRCS